MSFDTDPFDLQRFLDAQQRTYERAISELRKGRKRSHWMWYIFPQVDGLASSSTSKRYSIKSLEEARAYLQHPILGTRLLACSEAVLAIQGRTAADIFGHPADLKLRSCATLFAHVSPPESTFEQLLAKYFDGDPDDETLRILKVSN